MVIMVFFPSGGNIFLDIIHKTNYGSIKVAVNLGGFCNPPGGAISPYFLELKNE